MSKMNGNSKNLFQYWTQLKQKPLPSNRFSPFLSSSNEMSSLFLPLNENIDHKSVGFVFVFVSIFAFALYTPVWIIQYFFCINAWLLKHKIYHSELDSLNLDIDCSLVCKYNQHVWNNRYRFFTTELWIGIFMVQLRWC